MQQARSSLVILLYCLCTTSTLLHYTCADGFGFGLYNGFCFCFVVVVGVFFFVFFTSNFKVGGVATCIVVYARDTTTRSCQSVAKSVSILMISLQWTSLSAGISCYGHKSNMGLICVGLLHQTCWCVVSVKSVDVGLSHCCPLCFQQIKHFSRYNSFSFIITYTVPSPDLVLVRLHRSGTKLDMGPNYNSCSSHIRCGLLACCEKDIRIRERANISVGIHETLFRICTSAIQLFTVNSILNISGSLIKWNSKVSTAKCEYFWLYHMFWMIWLPFIFITNFYFILKQTIASFLLRKAVCFIFFLSDLLVLQHATKT